MKTFRIYRARASEVPPVNWENWALMADWEPVAVISACSVKVAARSYFTKPYWRVGPDRFKCDGFYFVFKSEKKIRKSP